MVCVALFTSAARSGCGWDRREGPGEHAEAAGWNRGGWHWWVDSLGLLTVSFFFFPSLFFLAMLAVGCWAAGMVPSKVGEELERSGVVAPRPQRLTLMTGVENTRRSGPARLVSQAGITGWLDKEIVARQSQTGADHSWPRNKCHPRERIVAWHFVFEKDALPSCP